jgi:hypothetical protein
MTATFMLFLTFETVVGINIEYHQRCAGINTRTKSEVGPRVALHTLIIKGYMHVSHTIGVEIRNVFVFARAWFRASL